MAAARKYPPKDAIEVTERMAAQGYSQVGIGRHFGVSLATFKRWCEEYEAIQSAFEVGRETERQALHALIVQSAVANKPANANAMFLLKCRHGYRETDSANTKVNVEVNTPTNVLVIKDHGSNEQWAAKVAEQQRRLTQGSAQQQLQAPQGAQDGLETTVPLPATVQPAFAHLKPSEPIFEAPVWRQNA